MAIKQVHIYYSGRVQGVGFRFTAEDIARRLKVAGQVKNLRDGRVEIVAETEESVLKDFLEEISQAMAHYIQHAEIYWESPSYKFKNFKVAFD